MTLNAAIEAELPFLRAEAAARMTDACRITKPGVGAPAYNPATGQYDDPPPATVYEGACRIPNRAGTFTAANSSQTFGVGEFPLDLPFGGTESVAAGQTVLYLTSTHNPSLVGRKFGIVESLLQSQATVLRFRIKAAVSP